VRRRFVGWVAWQRIPVSETRILEPEREAITAGIYAVLFVFLAGGIGLAVRALPLAALGASGASCPDGAPTGDASSPSCSAVPWG
jgi:hypothetical protein